jgi:hypothetical protein
MEVQHHLLLLNLLLLVLAHALLRSACVYTNIV